MGPLSSCDRDSFGVNFVRYDDETLHQQMESMFRSDFNEPMISSKVAMSVEDQRALLQMENSVKLVNGHYQLALPWRHKSVNLPIERTLGMQWAMETDDFNFRIMDGGKAPTRRGILSVVRSIYDPLGVVAPVILPAKSLLQSLCKQK